MRKHKPDLKGADLPTVVAHDRRDGQERRRRHLRAFLFQFHTPRRRGLGRREHDPHGVHSDFHEPVILLVVLVTMSLCVVDVYATLTLLQGGGVELNPIMRKLIMTDVWLFFGLKYTITAAGLFVLVSYKRFRLYRGFSSLHTLYGVLAIYVLLVVYQMRLLSVAAG